MSIEVIFLRILTLNKCDLFIYGTQWMALKSELKLDRQSEIFMDRLSFRALHVSSSVYSSGRVNSVIMLLTIGTQWILVEMFFCGKGWD